MKKIFTKLISIFLGFCLLLTSILPSFSSVNSFVKTAEAASCSASSSSGYGNSSPARVGGVALDQAATFLADMTDIVGAYYDQNKDRIVFVGTKGSTTLPEFDKDDLAVAIRAVIFNSSIPMLSIERDPANPTGPNNKVFYYGGIENTRFGQVLFDADYKMKQYEFGYDANQQKIVSSVPGYKSFFDRYLELGPSTDDMAGSRFWLTPKLVSLKKDDTSNSFVFDQVSMQIKTEPLGPNTPNWDQAATDFAKHHTDNYDLFAQETPSYADAKQLGKIVAVIKWLNDTGVSSDFSWAKDYTPKIVDTPEYVPVLYTPWVEKNGVLYQLYGGAEYKTPNTYQNDTGASSDLKTASEAVNAPKEEIHWEFTQAGTQFEAVAVAAEAFRSLGSYSTSEIDMSYPMAGDLNLTFQRSYNSFSGGQNGIGRGWSFWPARLVDNKPIAGGFLSAFCSTTDTYIHRYKLAFQAAGQHEVFTYDCDANDIGSYVPDEAVFHSKITDARINSTETQYTVTLKDQTQYVFQELFNDPEHTTTYYMRLIQIKDKNGNSITYNYDSDNKSKLVSITDGKNHTIALSYNSNNLVFEIKDWTNRKVQYGYDDQGNLISVTDRRGQITKYSYDSNFKLATITNRGGEIVIENTYTPEAKVAAQKDAGAIVTNRTYDEPNRKITTINNQSPARTDEITYDEKARVLEQKDSLGFLTKYTYGIEYAPLTITDKNGNKITNTYDANGNLTSVTYPDLKKVMYQYDAKNRPTKITDERYGIPGKDTTNTYDAVGNLTQTNESGQISSFTYDPTGEMLSYENPLTKKTTWTRDIFGNPLTETAPTNFTTTFTYDAIGRLKKKTDANAKVFSFTYDNNNNLLTQTDAAGTTSNIYDKENRLTKVTLPDNTITEFTYNASGTLISTKDPALSLNSYGYDPYQNLISQKDALNKITSYNYDALNRQTQTNSPLGKIYKYEYDANGNITKRTDANNNSTTYLYDSLNRLTKITYPDTKTVTFAYDNRGNRTQMVDSSGISIYTYDNFDRLTQATNAYGKVLKYTYTKTNNLKTITYPDSIGVVAYSYDGNNRLTSVNDPTNKITTYTYNKNGTLASRLLPNGIKTTYAYDGANRLITIIHTKSKTLATYSYTRDSVGNIKIATESGAFVGSARTAKYDYDVLGRITKATYPGEKTFEYAYDEMGNRLTQKVDGTTTTRYAYDDDYKLTQKNSLTSYSYDNNGNQTKKPSENLNPDPTYSYDFENRLISHTTSAGDTYDYKYDGLGNRLQKQKALATTRYIYDTSSPLSRLMATDGAQNSATKFWIYGLGLIYDSDNNYYLEDGSRNMRLIADATGSKRSGVSYDPFGNIRSSVGTLPDFRFDKQQLDSESNLYFLRARYYDPELGRFISRDPVKGVLDNPQTQNPYAYGLNNPINLDDPSGKQVVQACYTVYQAVVAGVPRYYGITTDFARRAGEQFVQKGITIEAIPGLNNLTKIDARGVEQVLIETARLQSQGGTLINKINSISPNNPIYEEAIKVGTQLLQSVGF